MPRSILRTLPLLAAATTALLLTSCGDAASPTTPAQVAGEKITLPPPIADATGNLTAALGAWTLSLDPETLQAILLPVHTASATTFGQGDTYALSIRPFFGPRDLRVSGIELISPNELKISVTVTHPFAVPTDTTRPATATKRLDLHVFETHLVLVAEGTDSFFDGAVTLNHGFVTNADGYRTTGPLFDPAGFGVSSANTFPYVMVGSYDSGNPGGNYNPTADGWQGTALSAPTGYGVFPQGANVERDLILDLGSGNLVNLGVIVVAKYQDPRNGTTATQKRANRLPDPGNPAALRYLLPQGAGDLERLTVTVTGTLPDNDPAATVPLTGEVLDWDGGATVIDPASWPNNSDLSQIPENSAPINAVADLPDLQASGPFPLGLTITPGDPITVINGDLTNTDSFPVTGAPVEVKGLVRLSDSQDSDDTSPTGVLQQVLSEASTAPLPNPGATLLPTVRYQAFTVTVTDVVAPPAGITFQSQEVPINADPAQAFRDIRTYTYEYKRIQAADPQGDLYYFYRWNASPNSWFVSRSTDGGDSWGSPVQIPTPFLGTLTTGVSDSLSMSVLPTLSVSQPIIVGSSGSSPTETLGMLRGTDSAPSLTTWNGAIGSIVGSPGAYTGTILSGDLSDLTGNRAYLLARDTYSSSPNHNRLVLFRTANAQAATPTWTQIATPDANGGGGLNGETNQGMVADLTGNLHVSYIAGPIGTNDVRYVKVTSPATSPVVGAEVNISNSGTDNVGESNIFVDSSGRALVVWERWLGNDSNQGRIYIARGDAAGTAFSAPVLVDSSGADCQMPDVIVDAAGSGAVIVAYMRRGVSADEIYLAARSADLTTELVAPTRAHTDIPAADVRYPHLIIDVVRQRNVVCYERSGFGGPLSAPDSNYEIRSRWFQLTP